jgi:predicted RNA-binding Zn-ribbon protein involved in translation (DUF1610 family)
MGQGGGLLAFQGQSHRTAGGGQPVKLGMSSFIWLYVALFLAVLFGAWLSFAWRCRKIRHDSHKAYPCPSCGEKIRFKNEVVFTRCPHCGAKVKLSELLNRDGH